MEIIVEIARINDERNVPLQTVVSRVTDEIRKQMSKEVEGGGGGGVSETAEIEWKRIEIMW